MLSTATNAGSMFDTRKCVIFTVKFLKHFGSKCRTKSHVTVSSTQETFSVSLTLKLSPGLISRITLHFLFLYPPPKCGFNFKRMETTVDFGRDYELQQKYRFNKMQLNVDCMVFNLYWVELTSRKEKGSKDLDSFNICGQNFNLYQE